MSAICQNFVGNAWRRDLCSNCFKSKEEHSGREQKDSGNLECLPPLVRSSAVYETVYETRNYSWTEKLSRSNSRLSDKPNEITKTSSESQINGLLSSKLVSLVCDNNQVSSSKPSVINQILNDSAIPTTNGTMETKGILKDSSQSNRTKPSVRFPDGNAQVIGYGGDVNYSSDEDGGDSSSDESTGSNDLTDEEKALKRITENNTDFNSFLANLMTDMNIKPGEYKKPQFGLKRDPPKISIKPFGSSKAISGLKVNVVAPVVKKINEKNTSEPKMEMNGCSEIITTSLAEEKEMLNKKLEALGICVTRSSRSEKVTKFDSEFCNSYMNDDGKSKGEIEKVQSNNAGFSEKMKNTPKKEPTKKKEVSSEPDTKIKKDANIESRKTGKKEANVLPIRIGKKEPVKAIKTETNVERTKVKKLETSIDSVKGIKIDPSNELKKVKKSETNSGVTESNSKEVNIEPIILSKKESLSDDKPEKEEEPVASELVEYQHVNHQPLTNKNSGSVSLTTFSTDSPKLFSPRSSFLHGTLEASNNDVEETPTYSIPSPTIPSPSVEKSNVYGEHPPRFATINSGKPAVSPKPPITKPKPKVPVKPSNLKLILERKLSQSSSNSSPGERTAEVPPTFIKHKTSPLSSPDEPEMASRVHSVSLPVLMPLNEIDTKGNVNGNSTEAAVGDLLNCSGDIGISDTDVEDKKIQSDGESPEMSVSSGDSTKPDDEACSDTTTKEESVTQDEDSSEQSVPLMIKSIDRDASEDVVSQSSVSDSTTHSVSSECSSRSNKRLAPMPPSESSPVLNSPPPPYILKKEQFPIEPVSLLRPNRDSSPERSHLEGRRVSTPAKYTHTIYESPVSLIPSGQDLMQHRKPRSQSLPRTTDILSSDPSGGSSGRYSPNSPRRMKRIFGFGNQEARGRDARKKNRFSLKKLLKFGQKEDSVKIQERENIRESKKSRLQIIHPLDLNQSGVEVIRRNSKTDEPDGAPAVAIQASQPKKGEDLRPEPPPRVGGSPPARPPPPRTPRRGPPSSPIPTPPSPPISASPESLYANLGHIRNSLTPKKPERSNSLKEINEGYQKRRAPQPPEQEYSIPMQRPLSPSEDGYITPGRSPSLHYQEPGRIYSVPLYASPQGRTLKRSESDRSMTPADTSQEGELSGSSSRWKSSRLSARHGRSLVHRNLEDNYGAVTSANLQALAQILDQLLNHRSIPINLHPIKLSTKLQWGEFNPLAGELPTVVGQRVFLAAQWLPSPTHVTLMLSQGALTTCIGGRGPYTFEPVTSFSDLVPSTLLPWKKESGPPDQLTEAYITVLPVCEVETLQEFAERTIVRRETDPQDWDRQVCFTQLQFITALKQLQAAGIEEVECGLEGFVLVRRLEEGTSESVPRLLILGESPQSPAHKKHSLCHTALTALVTLFQVDPESENEEGSEPQPLHVMKNILRSERATSLSQAQHILEFILWGPSPEVIQPDSSEQILSRWLDLERATVLNGVIRASTGGLTVLEEYHLLFLVRSTPRALREAVVAFLPESTNF